MHGCAHFSPTPIAAGAQALLTDPTLHWVWEDILQQHLLPPAEWHSSREFYEENAHRVNAVPAYLCDPDPLNGIALMLLFGVLCCPTKLEILGFSAGSYTALYIGHVCKRYVTHIVQIVDLSIGGLAFPAYLISQVDYFRNVRLLHMEADLLCKVEPASQGLFRPSVSLAHQR